MSSNDAIFYAALPCSDQSHMYKLPGLIKKGCTELSKMSSMAIENKCHLDIWCITNTPDDSVSLLTASVEYIECDQENEISLSEGHRASSTMTEQTEGPDLDSTQPAPIVIAPLPAEHEDRWSDNGTEPNDAVIAPLPAEHEDRSSYDGNDPETAQSHQSIFPHNFPPAIQEPMSNSVQRKYKPRHFTADKRNWSTESPCEWPLNVAEMDVERSTDQELSFEDYHPSELPSPDLDTEGSSPEQGLTEEEQRIVSELIKIVPDSYTKPAARHVPMTGDKRPTNGGNVSYHNSGTLHDLYAQNWWHSSRVRPPEQESLAFSSLVALYMNGTTK